MWASERSSVLLLIRVMKQMAVWRNNYPDTCWDCSLEIPAVRRLLPTPTSPRCSLRTLIVHYSLFHSTVAACLHPAEHVLAQGHGSDHVRPEPASLGRVTLKREMNLQ